MPFHAPADEQLDRNRIAALQQEKLASLLQAASAGNGFYRAKLAGIDPASAARSIESLPFTTKDELLADQAAHPPYGTNLSFPVRDYCRYHQTSGSTGAPLRCLDRATDWQWWKHCWAVIFRAAGVTANDRFVFPFSFGPFIGFWAAFECAVDMGNLCLPAGGMTTRARLRYLLDNGVTFVCCTPTYALHMAEAAAAEGLDLAASPVRALIVAGEPGGSIPATRERIESAWGARVFDHAGMTEVGAYAFECVERPGGLHVTESEFIAEVIDPATLRPVSDGQAGELVLTNLGRIGNPAIRYRTGDVVRLSRGRCACGRWFARIEGGILGRIDDMVIIRGNNVFPAAFEGILRRFADIAEYRVAVTEAAGLAELLLEIEPAAAADPRVLKEQVTQAVRDALNLRPVVKIVEAGSLPRYDMKAARWMRRNQNPSRT